MTDLMIRYNELNGFSEKQIAVEGKFTENLYETIDEWKKSKSANSNKDDVLKSWYSYIENYCDFSDCHNSLFLIMKKKQIYSFGESQVINCLTDNLVLLARVQHNIVHISEEQLKKIILDEYLMEE